MHVSFIATVARSRRAPESGTIPLHEFELQIFDTMTSSTIIIQTRDCIMAGTIKQNSHATLQWTTESHDAIGHQSQSRGWLSGFRVGGSTLHHGKVIVNSATDARKSANHGFW